jgi:thiol-disulfide isomerase/thioredoxin
MNTALILSCLVGFGSALQAAPPAAPLKPAASPAAATPAAEAEGILASARAKEKTVMLARRAHLDAGRNSKDFRGDCVRELAELAARLEREARPEVRQALLVSQLFHLTLAKEEPTPAQRARILLDVPALSRAWTLDPGMLSSLLEQDPIGFAAYVGRARDGHPDAGVRCQLLLDHFWEGLDARDEAVWKPDFETLQRDFKASPEARKAAEILEADRKTALGTPAPPFALASLEDPAVVYTLDTFKGRFVLVDFWATWCPPCRGEMPYLHRAWEAFKGKGLEILSLSFDRQVEHIAPFRLDPRTPMPWKHAFVKGANANPVSQAYGVKGIPKPLLVGPDGRIVASGSELHGERLLKTLARFLDK